MKRLPFVSVALFATFSAVAQVPVVVVVDMDAARPGIQASVVLREGTRGLDGVAVYIFDPSGTHSVFAIGYLGGIDRGIAFGHAPANTNIGHVVALRPTAGTPVNPGNAPQPWAEPFLDKGFVGPEVQYVEAGANGPAPFPMSAIDPIFTVAIDFESATTCDEFAFHLLDFTVVWSGGQGGAFSSTAINQLDAGGDSVPDQTQTAYGVDPDAALASPPAPYRVDFVDGPTGGGPATVVVTRAGDLDHDRDVDLDDLSTLLASFGTTSGATWERGDADGDGDIDLSDLSLLLSQFGWSCG